MKSKPFWQGTLEACIGNHMTTRTYKRNGDLEGNTLYWRQDIYTKNWCRIPARQTQLMARIDAAAAAKAIADKADADKVGGMLVPASEGGPSFIVTN